MGKLKVCLRFKEFNLELEGSRNEVPQLGQNLGRQIAGMITGSASNLAPGAIPLEAVNDQVNDSIQLAKKKKSGKSGSKSESQPLNWSYDGQPYGLPLQSWSGNDKAIWMLCVAEKVMGLKLGEIR